MNPKYEALTDELASLVDGDTDALQRWEETLADSDEARDLLFEAQRAAARVADAGADFEVPADLEARVLAALDARGASVVPASIQPVQVEHPNQEASCQQPTSPPSGMNQGEVIEQVSASSPSNKGLLVVLTLAGSGLLAAAAVALAWGLGAFRPSEGAPVVTTAGLGATVATVVRSADGSAQSGLAAETGGSLTAVFAGSQLPAGARVVTDRRTRTRLELSDGSTLTLNQDTEIVIGQHGRSVELRRGELLAEVEPHPGSPNARFETPSGVVEVVGTKFLLTASDDRASVRVTRGIVRVHGQGQSVEVKTGQEGLMARGLPPQVVPAVDLATSLAWSELGGGQGDDVPIAGLGELRANKPGQREQTERPLTLAHHKVRVRLVGSVARTEIEETFRNESGDELEGVYRFPLPPGARIASLALEVDGRWEEGAFVPKERARQIWRGVIRNATPEPRRQQEEFIWVPGPWRDPAILEWQQGGRFELRIFPIPARGERRIRLAYEQTVQPHGDGRRYVYPLAHAADDSTRVGHFEVDVRVAGQNVQAKSRGYEMVSQAEGNGQRLRYTREDFRPSGDIVIDYDDPSDDAELRYWTFRGQAVAAPEADTREDREVADAQRALHQDERSYVAFALRPELPGWTAAQQRDYVLVVDSSQSMVGERYERAVRLAQGMVAEMDRRDRVLVMACDYQCRVMEGEPLVPSSLAVTSVGEFLRKEEPAGASDLAATLREAVAAAQRLGAGRQRSLQVVYVGDGVATVGPRRAGSLAAEVEGILTRDNRRMGRLITVGIGQEADAAGLAAMARAGGGHYVPYVPGQRSSEAALAVLETTYGVSLEKATLEFPDGVVDVTPAELPNLRAGQELLFAARMERDVVEGNVVLRGTVAGRPFEQRYPVSLRAVASAGNAFVPRVWAAKTIEDLEQRGKGEDVARIVALSRGYGVMSRSTSLLVLESEAMFRAFGVDRARPTLQWSGEEEAIVGQSEGALAVADGSSAGVGNFGATASADALASGRAPAASRVAVEEAELVAPRLPLAEPVTGAVSERRVRRSRNRRPGRWMRKVWFREGRVTADSQVRARDLQAVQVAEQRLREQPDSRDRTRDLVRALSRAGELERAEEVARQWLERDKLDPEALTYLSDVVGRRGRRDEALRLLTGIVDLAADDRTLQRRLANAFERAGKAHRACAHRVALAESQTDDERLVADAVRCERSLGRTDAARRLLALLDDDERLTVVRLAARAPTPGRIRGRLLLDADWTGGGDVDLTLVTPQGTRLSWMGGRTTVVGDDATRVGHERLGLRQATPGTYYIEVTRANPNERTPVRGTIRVRAYNEARRLPFELTGERAVVGRVSVVRRWRMAGR